MLRTIRRILFPTSEILAAISQEEEPTMTNRLAFYQFCLAVRRKEALALCLALCTLGLGLCASAKEPRPSFIIFDAPGAGTDAYQGTAPLAVDATGVIVGGYLDENYAWHGFLRAKGGRITTFDPSGAGTGPFQGTQAWSLNPVGEITGLYVYANGRSEERRVGKECR